MAVMENVWGNYLLQENFKKAWETLLLNTSESKQEEIQHYFYQTPTFETPYPWLNQSLMAYYEYLKLCFQEIIQKSTTKEELATKKRAEEKLANTLREILQTPTANLEELEALLQERLKALGWHSQFGKSAGYYAPYIWQEEELAVFSVQMPHSIEKATVHFMDSFILKGWLSFFPEGLFQLGAWVVKGEIYCSKATYAKSLTQPKFQISLLKHETQHRIDGLYSGVSKTHMEYRGKLVELYYYSDVQFLKFLLESASFTDEGDESSYGAALLLQDLKQYLKEVGILKPEEFLAEITTKPLEWMRARGQIQQAALAILDRDTKKILGL